MTSFRLDEVKLAGFSFEEQHGISGSELRHIHAPLKHHADSDSDMLCMLPGQNVLNQLDANKYILKMHHCFYLWAIFLGQGCLGPFRMAFPQVSLRYYMSAVTCL